MAARFWGVKYPGTLDLSDNQSLLDWLALTIFRLAAAVISSPLTTNGNHGRNGGALDITRSPSSIAGRQCRSGSTLEIDGTWTTRLDESGRHTGPRWHAHLHDFEVNHRLRRHDRDQQRGLVNNTGTLNVGTGA